MLLNIVAYTKLHIGRLDHPGMHEFYSTSLERSYCSLSLHSRLGKLVSSCGDHLLQGIKSKVGGCITASLCDLKLHLESMNKKCEGAVAAVSYVT